MVDVEHTIGLLLGTEDDWPRAYEALLRRLGVVTDDAGRGHRTHPSHQRLERGGPVLLGAEQEPNQVPIHVPSPPQIRCR